MEIFENELVAKQAYDFMNHIMKIPSVNRLFDRKVDELVDICWDMIYDNLTEEFSESIRDDEDPMQRVLEVLEKIS